MLICPGCKSSSLKKFGKKWLFVDGVRQKVQQYQCNTCGRITIHPKDITLPARDNSGKFIKGDC